MVESKPIANEKKTISTQTSIEYDSHSYELLSEAKERRIYLYGIINSYDDEELPAAEKPTVREAIRWIMKFNREDLDIPVEERKPIRIFIDSPGGDVYAGFALVAAIKCSKTPVWTFNLGMCCSMAFYIVIAGHQRFSLPYATFLMHDGSEMLFGTGSKIQDTMKFNEHYQNEVIKKHVLAHGSMKEDEYDEVIRKELYMLPERALEYHFIDKIMTNFDDIF